MDTPLPDSLPPAPAATPARDWRYWPRRLLVCNPFFLVSAALLLFGINRLSVDPHFLAAELAKLLFNSSALQVYEALLVLVAIVLARRKIWYDSTLLVVLENGFVLVPFIFVTQAVLIGQDVALAVCAAGAGLAAARFAALKRYLGELNLPPRLLAFGALLLALNLALPLLFRSVIEHGTDKWIRPNRLGWLVVLPLLQGLASLLPRPRHWGGLEPQRSWLPQLIFSLWMTVSAVHLHCVGYVGNIVFDPCLLVALLWAMAWTGWNRLTDFVRAPAAHWQVALLLPPGLIPLLAAAHSEIFFPLVLVNTVLFGALYCLKQHRRPVLLLLQASTVALMAGLPENWGQWLLPDFTRARAAALGLGANVLVCSLFSRVPWMGLGGALMAAGGPGLLHVPFPAAPAVQAGLLFLLAHSLRWTDGAHRGAAGLRGLAALAWVMHSFAWTHGGESSSTVVVLGGAALMLALTALAHRRKGVWPVEITVAATLVALAPTLNALANLALQSPAGLVAILSSFLLFGLGTALALSKHHWAPK